MPGAVLQKRGGQYTYCQNLVDLFKDDDEILYLNIDQPKGKNIPGINKIWFSWKDLYYKIKDSDCDIVHINGYLEPSTWQEFLIAQILSKKIIYSPHFHPFKFLRHPLMGKCFFYTFIAPLLFLTKKIITIGKSDFDFFNKIRNNVISIPHHFIANDVVDIVSRNKNPNMILFVGRNEPNKGLDYIYELPKKYEVHCVTGGVLQRSDFIQHTCISHEELSELYAAASLVVIPSGYEAFSLVALEAFIHNTPVVMSSNVKIEDYLDGEDGYSVFNYGDKSDFIKKVESTIGKKVSINEIMSKFNPEKIKTSYKQIFHEIMD